MKKLLFCSVLSMLAFASRAQTVTAVITAPPCHADGTLTATATGLTPPLTFTYYISGTTVVHTGVTGMTDALSLYTGAPCYIICTGSSTSSSSAYTSFAGAPPFTYTTATTTAVCPALGTATATVTGGMAPYTYTWYNSGTTTPAATGNPVSLPTGGYDVMITDANGCQYGSAYAHDSIAVYTSPGFSYSITTTAANCTNGTATVGPITGGLAPYSYLWSTMAGTAGITGLSMGSYNVTVTDANGCSDAQYTYISQAVSITAPVTPTPATCTAADGAVIAFGAGGTPPYTYLWNNGATTQSQSGLPAGYYTVVATDANGCIGNGYGNVTASTPITATYVTTPSSCTAPTGTATLTLAGGTTPYTTNWYTSPAQTGLTATALSEGNYGFHVTDAAGCVRTGTVTINPVDIINMSFSTTPATCTASNGSISVTSSGGVAPLSYLWSSGGAVTSSLSSVPAGYYTVTITDANGCHKHGYANVPVYSPLHLAMANTSPSCIFTTDGSIHATAWGGTSPYTYSWSTGGSASSISSLGSGYYSVYVSDAAGCTGYDYTYLVAGTSDISCYCTISGIVYHDLNGNCVQDAGEPGIPGIQIHCSGRGYVYTDASGHYAFRVPTGSYTITETVQTLYPLATCQSNGIVVSAVASSGCTNVVDFANSVATIHDIHVSTWDYNHAIPGNIYTQATIISNQGTVAEATVAAGYQTDGQLAAATFVPGGIFSGSSNWYNATLPTMAPTTSQVYHENYNVPADIPLSTNVVFKDSAVSALPMSTWLTDYTPWNNVNYFSTTVVGSYDPNFKEVNPKGVGAPGYITLADSTLEYMVHFQNTGTYYAEKIVVIDTLDPNLDWTTLHPIYQSHNCLVTLDEHGVATFTFNGIHLPYQALAPVTSNGMFTYTVKTRHGLAAGTQIQNRASIYFDYNQPIMTNRTLNTIQNIVGIPATAAQASSFSLYPNPADKTCFAVINSEVFGNADMQITDITGKILITKTVALTIGSQTLPVDIAALAPGMYLVSLHNQGKIETQKLVIIK